MAHIPRSYGYRFGACVLTVRWLPKLWSLFGYPHGDPKRDHNVDNHPIDLNPKPSTLNAT